jgi:molybdopterin converting factor small subunit
MTPIKVLIPVPLRRSVGGAAEIELDAASVEAALSSLAQSHPDLRHRLFDETGRLRGFINVFLGQENLRDLQPERDLPLLPGDILAIIPAIAGGRSAA